MNGIIFMEAGKFAKAQLGEQAWEEVLRQAGIPSRLYVPVADYPDVEFITLLTALSVKMEESVQVILENLGEFIAPDLINTYHYLINPDWKTIDLIANTEQTIHEVLRKAGSKTNPPQLKCWQPDPQQVIVVYTSPRKMCSFAKGIVKGIAKHYDERITIKEPTCMLKGGAECELVITLA